MKSKHKLVIYIFLYFFCFTIHAQEIKQPIKLNRPIFGIITPLPEESIFLLKNITHQKIILIDKIKYHIGTIKNKNIVFVNSGLGKINSAIIATRLIKDFHPNLILMTGSSGNINPSLKKMDVIIGKNVINADFGELSSTGVRFPYKDYLKNPNTNTRLPLEFNFDNSFLEFISHLNKDKMPNILLGKIATSDELPNKKSQLALLRQANVDVIEMEGVSLMQVCWLFKANCIVIRGVSNDAEEPITKKDIKMSADNAAKVAIQMVESWKL
jgi:adenosylhomocysteine nucleosidase